MILLLTISLQSNGKSSPIPEVNEKLSNAIKLLTEEIEADFIKQDDVMLGIALVFNFLGWLADQGKTDFYPDPIPRGIRWNDYLTFL